MSYSVRMEVKRTERFGLRLERELLKKIKARARADNRKLGDWIRQVLWSRVTKLEQRDEQRDGG